MIRKTRGEIFRPALRRNGKSATMPSAPATVFAVREKPRESVLIGRIALG